MLKERKILFVDDDADVLDLYSLLMENKGYRMYRASSGVEAIEMIDNIDFDCIVTDLRMPDGNGLKVRDIAHAKKIPLLIVTGYKGPYQDKLEGQDAVLEKPVRAKDLLDVIEKLAG